MDKANDGDRGLGSRTTIALLLLSTDCLTPVGQALLDDSAPVTALQFDLLSTMVREHRTSEDGPVDAWSFQTHRGNLFLDQPGCVARLRATIHQYRNNYAVHEACITIAAMVRPVTITSRDGYELAYRVDEMIRVMAPIDVR